MISGISVQPSTTASQPWSFRRADDLLEVGDRLRLEGAADQLVHDDAVARLALGRARAEIRQAARRKLLRIDLAVDQPARARDADAAEAARDRLRRDDLGDVQPGQRRARQDMGQGLMDGVVGADQEIGADLLRACPPMPASARPRAASRRGRWAPCSRRATACASRLRDGHGARAAPRLRRRWSDSRGKRLRRSRRRCRYAESCCEFSLYLLRCGSRSTLTARVQRLCCLHKQIPWEGMICRLHVAKSWPDPPSVPRRWPAVWPLRPSPRTSPSRSATCRP